MKYALSESEYRELGTNHDLISESDYQEIKRIVEKETQQKGYTISLKKMNDKFERSKTHIILCLLNPDVCYKEKIKRFKNVILKLEPFGPQGGGNIVLYNYEPGS